MKINLKKSNIPIKINQKKYFDKRGYFQEYSLQQVRMSRMEQTRFTCQIRYYFF